MCKRPSVCGVSRRQQYTWHSWRSCGAAAGTAGTGNAGLAALSVLSAACRRYCEVTGHDVVACRFRVMRDDDVHGWLGASPDGLVPGLLTNFGEI